jgi:hypothetical protein
MSLLTICQAACNIAPIAAPTSIVGNSDQTALLLLALANQAGQEIARRPQGGWVSMIREYEFVTQAIEEQGGAVANVGGVGVISGLLDTTGITPYAWVASGTGLPTNALVTAVTSTTVTINQAVDEDTGGSYEFGQASYALPSDFQRPIDNTFWDRTRYWAMRGPMSPQQWQVYKSSSLGNATVQRRFMFQRVNGQNRISIDPTPFEADAVLVFDYVSNAYCESAAGVAQTAWTADDDIGVVDEYLIQLCVTHMLLRRLGLSYSDEMARYEREMSKAMATDGAAAILNLTPISGMYLLGPWNVQDGGYPGGSSADSGGFIIGVSGIGSGSI